MDGVERALEVFFRATTPLVSAAFGLICFTCAWRAARHTPFRGVLLWIAVLTFSYVIAVPLTTHYPVLGLYFRVVTRGLLIPLAYQCIKYLINDPPHWRLFFK